MPYPLGEVDGGEKGRWRRWEEGKDWELGLVFKMKEKSVFFLKNK